MAGPSGCTMTAPALRYRASSKDGRLTIKLKDTETGAVGFYDGPTGQPRLGIPGVDITSPQVLDRMYWVGPIGNGRST